LLVFLGRFGQGHDLVAAISLCSGLTVCLPPRSFLPLQVSSQGS
jgi:hypothetical protein